MKVDVRAKHRPPRCISYIDHIQSAVVSGQFYDGSNRMEYCRLTPDFPNEMRCEHEQARFTHRVAIRGGRVNLLEDLAIHEIDNAVDQISEWNVASQPLLRRSSHQLFNTVEYDVGRDWLPGRANKSWW